MNKKLMIIILLITQLPLAAQISNKFTLIVHLFNEKNAARCEEYIECLKINLAHPLIDKIHVVYEYSNEEQEQKSIILNFLKTVDIPISYMPSHTSFNACLSIANELYPNKATIIANGDIYFDETLNILENYDLEDKFLAPTRWDILPDGTRQIYHFKTGQINFLSQDCWMFKSPFPMPRKTILLGKMRCENIIMGHAFDMKYEVQNPSLTIKCWHLHKVQIRHYTEAPPMPKNLRWVRHAELK